MQRHYSSVKRKNKARESASKMNQKHMNESIYYNLNSEADCNQMMSFTFELIALYVSFWFRLFSVYRDVLCMLSGVVHDNCFVLS